MVVESGLASTHGGVTGPIFATCIGFVRTTTVHVGVHVE